jgi:hypothetical protein
MFKKSKGRNFRRQHRSSDDGTAADDDDNSSKEPIETNTNAVVYSDKDISSTTKVSAPQLSFHALEDDGLFVVILSLQYIHTF